MTANAISNVVSFTIADAARQACDGAMETFMTYLKPALITLNDGQRRSQTRVGAKGDALIIKAVGYARSHPALLPSFLDIEEFQRDVDTIQILTPYRQAMAQLVRMMDDTMSQARRESFTAGRALYQGAKLGAELNQPGAVMIRDDLAVCCQRSA